MKKEQGITLIVLVITIILLLILAGISIATLTGENGILAKASMAQEENKKVEYEETLKIIGNGHRPNKIENNLSSEEYMEQFKIKIEKNELFKNAKVELDKGKQPITIIVTTKEGYVYWVTEDKVEYVGKRGEDVPPDLIVPTDPTLPDDLEKSNVTFEYNPSTWTAGEVEVRISTKVEKYTLQYSTDGTTWNNYTTAITMKENGDIYVRLVNKLGEEGGYATGRISNIDKDSPENAIISFNTYTVTAGGSVTAAVSQSDNLSGVDIENCKYVFTTSNAEIGIEDTSKYTGTFSKEIDDKLTLSCSNVGTYYLHVLTVDQVGNRKETISSKGVNVTFNYTLVSNGKLTNGSPTLIRMC